MPGVCHGSFHLRSGDFPMTASANLWPSVARLAGICPETNTPKTKDDQPQRGLPHYLRKLHADLTIVAGERLTYVISSFFRDRATEGASLDRLRPAFPASCHAPQNTFGTLWASSAARRETAD